MTRREKVLAALRELTQTRQGVSGSSHVTGFTTDELAQVAGILRNNCSAELNELVREGFAEKTHGRPTLYRLVQTRKDVVAPVEKSLSGFVGNVGEPSFATQPGRHTPEYTGAASFISVERPLPLHRAGDSAFDWGVATERSLHDAVQQAKMALTYPPHGMHVLLLGETGVGKSTFSRRMHEYAVRHGVLHENAPFVAFNCSEYANNQEILLDQLFGHIRGAYTGAHGDKPGLVEQADEGLLFLDEVHRLSPQGQEMLFHLLDYGTFRRLGETQLERTSRVLLVAATTESPESALLSTFRRRIPVVIRLPALRDWALYDRYELVYSLCRDEARILGMPIKVSAAALDTLLFSRFSANIGDLKNTLKLACARAYRDDSGTVIHVLPEHVVIPPAEGPKEVLLRSLSQSSDLLVTPDGDGPPPLPILEEGSRHAKFDKLSRTLYELGFDTEEILESLERELKKQSPSGSAGPASVADLRQFVGEQFFMSMTRSWSEIERRLSDWLSKEDSEAAFLRVAIHLYGVVRSAHTQSESSSAGLVDITERVNRDSPDAFYLAGRLLRAFTAMTRISLPEYETAIVAMLLRPKEAEAGKRTGLVVALFGDAIAKHVVDTATRLTHGSGVVAVDIPLQTPVEVMDARLSEAVERADEGRGIVLLTDIPRFAQDGGWRAPGDVTVECVLRPDLRTVVSAIQAVQTGKLPLSELAKWLRQRNFGVEMMTPWKKRVVWGCCLTGKGTARAVERLIRDALPPDLYDCVEVIPKELGHTDVPRVPDDGLVAAVGSVDPGIFGVPFFSVESLLTREGIDQLLNVLYMGDTVEDVVQPAAENQSGTVGPLAQGAQSGTDGQPGLGVGSVSVRESDNAVRSVRPGEPARGVETVSARGPVSRFGPASTGEQASAGGSRDVEPATWVTSTAPEQQGQPVPLVATSQPATAVQSTAAATTNEDDMLMYISQLLQRDLVFVNPDLALRASTEVWDKMVSALGEAGLETVFKRETRVRFCLHTAYVIERLIKQEEMVHPYRDRLAQRYPTEWNLMQTAWQPISDVFRLPVSENELGYLFELVFAERELEVFDG